jgi:hypothetical protein
VLQASAERHVSWVQFLKAGEIQCRDRQSPIGKSGSRLRGRMTAHHSMHPTVCGNANRYDYGRVEVFHHGGVTLSGMSSRPHPPPEIEQWIGRSAVARPAPTREKHELIEVLSAQRV